MTARSGEARERSGEEGLPDEGRRVSCSVLRSTRSESTYASWIRVSLVAAEESEVEENQVGW